MRALLLWICLALAAVAQEPLTLGELLRHVEQHHPILRQADLNLSLARAKVTEKEGAFDPSLLLNSGYQSYNSPTSPGKGKEFTQNGLDFVWTTPSGVKLSAGMDINRGDVKSPASLTGEGGTYYLEAKIPLLRGLDVNEKSIAWQQAQLALPLAQAERALLRLGLLRGAGEAYWDWAAAWQLLEVNQRLLRLAEERLAVVRQRVEAGDMARIDATETEQELERRRGLLVRARRLTESSALKLAFYLWKEPTQEPALPRPEQAPAKLEEPRQLSAEEANQARLQAVERRPEFQGLAVQKEVVALDRALAENDQRPALNLTVSPGVDLGAQGVGPVFKGGLELIIPLRTREADGRLEQARIKLQDLDLKSLLQARKVLLEVEDAISAVDTAYERYRAAARELELAREVERGERYKFEMGDSTVFLINQRERATAEAEMRLLEVHGELLKARLGLHAATAEL